MKKEFHAKTRRRKEIKNRREEKEKYFKMVSVVRSNLI